MFKINVLVVLFLFFSQQMLFFSVTDKWGYKTRLWCFETSAGETSEQVPNNHLPHHLIRDEVTQLSCSQTPIFTFFLNDCKHGLCAHPIEKQN